MADAVPIRPGTEANESDAAAFLRAALAVHVVEHGAPPTAAILILMTEDRSQSLSNFNVCRAELTYAATYLNAVAIGDAMEPRSSEPGCG